MKRKQFLNRLLQISELNGYLNPLKDIPLVFSKPFKMEHRGDNRDTHLCNRSKQPFNPHNHDNEQFRQGEVLIITQNGAHNHVTKINTNKRNGSKRRLKSVPAHPGIGRNQYNQQFSMEATDYMLQQSSDRKFSFASVQMKQKALPKTTHFMSISEIRPQVSPTKKLAHKQLVYTKKGVQNVRSKELQKDQVAHKQFIGSCGQEQSVIKTTRVAAKPKKIIEVPNYGSIKVQTSKTNQSLNQTGGNETREEQRKAKISLRKEINKNYTKPFTPPPKLTAKSYIVYEMKASPEQSKLIVSFNCKLSQEVASLTKIMTCVLTLEICKDFCIDKYATEVTVGRMETTVGGTTADLEEGQVYTIEQLLYGLMLPSGNDASVALAVWGGGHLLQNQRRMQQKKVSLDKQRKRQSNQLSKYQPSTSCLSSTALSEYRKPTKSECYARFIQQMNNKAKCLSLSKTTYANSHGLINTSNKSSAFDVAILCEYAMKNQFFRTIVHCRNFKATIKVIRGGMRAGLSQDKSDTLEGERENYQRSQVKYPQYVSTTSIEWQNTHKLLHLRPKEYLGIKTGFTTAAGPCLASCVSVEGRQFIIVVLGCERMSSRFHETQILKKWLYKHENITRPKAKQSTSCPHEVLCEYEREQGVSQANLSSILKQLAREQQIED